jgi:hypothetical protein
LKERLTEQGLDVFGSSSEEMLAVMRADTKKWGEVIAATGAKMIPDHLSSQQERKHG